MARWLLPLFVLILDVVIVLFVMPHEPVRDEAVFFPAARAFADAGVFPSLDFLRHYPAPQAPLTLYSLESAKPATKNDAALLSCRG